jgi:hypothetical protein
MTRIICILTMTAIAALTYGCGEDVPTSAETSAAEAGGVSTTQAPVTFAGGQLPGRGSVLRLLGDAVAYEDTVPDIDGDEVDDPALCFDVDVFDASGRKVGTATDCLSDITGVGDGMSLVGTTFFRLNNGTFVARGHTTVQPITTSAPTPITHTTGAVPMAGANGILSGTGAYSGFEAQVRLSGAVNLSRLDAEGRIAFDCLFAVTPLR